jgi:hypothetical protein
MPAWLAKTTVASPLKLYASRHLSDPLRIIEWAIVWLVSEPLLSGGCCIIGAFCYLCFYQICRKAAQSIHAYLTAIMKYLLTLTATVLVISCFSQSNYDHRLLAKYNDAQIVALQESNPEVIEFWEYFLDHGYEIKDIPSGKENGLTEEVAIKNVDNINILALGVGSPGAYIKYFKIKGMNKMLVLHSSEQFVKSFKASKGL